MIVWSKNKLLLLALIHRRRKKRKRFYWVHPINVRRNLWGEHSKLDKMKVDYPNKFFEYTRLKPEQFDYVLNEINNSISKKCTNFRQPIHPRIRLYVTLRYLATGDSLKTISLNYSIGLTTAWIIIRETCPEIWKALQPTYVAAPTKLTWEQSALCYESKWNFPHCIGAIDGKHCLIQAPKGTGSIYFNYKKTFSIVLLALVDADYRFTVVDIGAYGKQSDGGIFSSSNLGERLKDGSLDIPAPRAINQSTSSTEIPYFIVGDDAFPLNSYLLRPYPGTFLSKAKRVFNYRLSRARRVSENAFGIMASRFRIFRRPILAEPHQVENVIKAVVALHNYLRTDETSKNPSQYYYCPTGYADNGNSSNGLWRNEAPALALKKITRSGKNNYKKDAFIIRDELTRYFNAEGALPWQDSLLGFDEQMDTTDQPSS